MGFVDCRVGLTVWAVSALILSGVAPARADPPDTPFGISELKVGALHHDTPGLWSGFSRERAGVDANFEILFLPWAQTFGGYLRPAIGGTFNFNGDTSKVYADLRWEVQAPSGLFFALGMGAAIHNGGLGLVDDAHKALGSPVLFHPSAEIGYRFDGVNSISVFADHMSNGFTRHDNEGMDTVGIRFGHTFGALQRNAPADFARASFAGPYIGAFAGYQFSSADWRPSSSAEANATGLIAGGFAGYTWQSSSGIFGIEADAAVARSRSSVTCISSAASCQMNVSALYSIRPRFGWVIDNSMIYGTGGLAIVTSDSSVVNNATGQRLGTNGAANYGVAVGAGVEHKFSPNLGLRAEVMHYGFPGLTVSLPGGEVENRYQTTVGRVGISWYFN